MKLTDAAKCLLLQRRTVKHIQSSSGDAHDVNKGVL